MGRTLGGVIACNLAGPRRIKSGAARDHFLGFRAVSGRAEIFKAGGKVVKNVTGYDLPKLMAGSYGTLAALEEVTVKVLPRPETSATVLVFGVAPEHAIGVMAAALGSPHEVSGAAYLPPGTPRLSSLPSGFGAVVLRVEGPEPSVAYRRDALMHEFADAGETAELGNAKTHALGMTSARWRWPGSVIADLAFPVALVPYRGGQTIARG